MNKILSYVRRCVEDYDMIQAGDRVAVGVSGGKDSLTLLVALARLREFYPKPFTVEAYTLDMGHVDGGEGMDFTGVEALCRELDVPFTLLHSEIHHIIFDLRKEKNPCSMCAKMRRGALHNALREHGITKIALGHHFDDAVETFFLSLFYEGRLSCFQPVTYLDRTGITQIRPLLYCGEGMLRNAAERKEVAAEQVNNDIQAAYTLYLQSYTELETQQKSVELARQNYQVVNNRYLNQLALITDMIDATNMKLDAELGEVDARINIAYAYYKMKYIAGQL